MNTLSSLYSYTYNSKITASTDGRGLLLVGILHPCFTEYFWYSYKPSVKVNLAWCEYVSAEGDLKYCSLSLFICFGGRTLYTNLLEWCIGSDDVRSVLKVGCALLSFKLILWFLKAFSEGNIEEIEWKLKLWVSSGSSSYILSPVN